MNRRKALLQPVHDWRFYFILAALGVLLLLLVWRVVMLQVVPGVERGHEFLQRQGDVRTIRKEKIPANRGMITDRNGEPLAVSTPVVSIYANPKEMDLSADYTALAASLKMPVEDLQDKLLRFKNKQFVYLRRHMTPNDAELVMGLKIHGLYGEREYRRYYPAGEVAAHLVGFTDIDDDGQEGMELAFNSWLEAKSGEKRVMKDLVGNTIRDIEQLAPAQPGKDLQLSVDLRLQYLAYRELKKAVYAHGAKSGSLVMLDVNTGEVLAMANQPSFNPNNRGKLNPAALRNRALTDEFEPGSTAKPFTMVAAFESGKYKPSTMVDTSPGFIRVGPKTLMDPVNYGLIDVTKIITKSSQVGTSRIALSLDPHAVRSVFSRVGLGSSTATGFPGETAGFLPDRPEWSPIERATFAFGHGLAVNNAQLAQAYSVFAAGGIKRNISLLKQQKPSAGERVMDAKVAEDVVSMLKTVTEKGGTAVRAHIPAYSVAGKTGTAHKVGSGGYSANRYTAIFAGFAPASRPKLAVVVVIDEPAGDEYYGGEVAAPVFGAVMGNGLRILNVSPDQWDDFHKEAIVSRQ